MERILMFGLLMYHATIQLHIMRQTKIGWSTARWEQARCGTNKRQLLSGGNALYWTPKLRVPHGLPWHTRTKIVLGWGYSSCGACLSTQNSLVHGSLPSNRQKQWPTQSLQYYLARVFLAAHGERRPAKGRTLHKLCKKRKLILSQSTTTAFPGILLSDFVVVDILGLRQKGRQRNRNTIVITDRYLRLRKATSTPNTSTLLMVNLFLGHCIVRFGIPRDLPANSGPKSVRKVFFLFALILLLNTWNRQLISADEHPSHTVQPHHHHASLTLRSWEPTKLKLLYPAAHLHIWHPSTPWYQQISVQSCLKQTFPRTLAITSHNRCTNLRQIQTVTAKNAQDSSNTPIGITHQESRTNEQVANEV